MKLDRKLLVAGIVLLLAVPAMAQDSQASVADESLRDLQTEARRLTALATIPAEARDAAEALLVRGDALREQERSLQIEELQAYIAALRAGDSAAVAREIATEATGQQRVELARERETLAADVEALVEQTPEAAALLRWNNGAYVEIVSGAVPSLGFPGGPYFHSRLETFGSGAGAGAGFSRPPTIRGFSQRSPAAPFRMTMPYEAMPAWPGSSPQPGSPELP